MNFPAEATQLRSWQGAKAIALAIFVFAVVSTAIPLRLHHEAYDVLAAYAPMLAGAAALVLSFLVIEGAPNTSTAIAAAWRHPALRLPLTRAGTTPVSRMRSFWGLLSSYWLSDRWVEAWSLTLAVIVITTILSKSSVWAATASADFLNSIVRFHSPSAGVDPLVLLITSVGAFAAIHLGRVAGVGLRHFVSTTLHRRARGWTQGQFSAGLLANNHVAMSLTSNRDGGPSGKVRMPDNIDQRVDECTENLFAGIIGLAMGVWGAVASIYFISVAILERSVEVAFLERWFANFAAWGKQVFGPEVGEMLAVSPGEYGTAVLVAVLIAVYVPAGTFCAWCLGRVLERQTLKKQARSGSWRGELNDMLGRSGQLAISHGQRVQARTNNILYRAVDHIWHRMNITTSAILVFTDGYNFLSKRLVAYLPALPAFMSGTMTFRSYSATSELAAELINDCSFFLQVMPAIATLRANAFRLNEVAEAIESAHDREEFYGRTGLHAFRHVTQDAKFGLTLQDVNLCHRGHDTEPFLRLHHANMRPGDWVYVRGANGSGKSSLLKAIAGLWPYGSGDVVRPHGAVMFFAGQDPDVPARLTLKQLVTYPHFGDAYSDIEVCAALSDVGLGRFLRDLDEELHHGKTWHSVMSGGQRQRLVLARILLQRPDILLLDEACSALDRTAVAEFHRLIRKHCPDAIVVSIMHEPEPPMDPSGRRYYNMILQIEDGRAALRSEDIVIDARRKFAAELGEPRRR